MIANTLGRHLKKGRPWISLLVILIFVIALADCSQGQTDGREEGTESMEEQTESADEQSGTNVYRNLLLAEDYGDEVTYVTGHMNPDSDAIGSAMAYAWLLNE